jgi:PiT family inorganic phosphate transporter
MITGITIAAAILVALANGANDNFKGVASLYGSGTASYRQALIWATVTTVLGSLTALVLSNGMIEAFSGRGLVPSGVVSDQAFAGAVAIATAATVALATRFGFPVSTTHALIGGLVGAGLLASPSGVQLAQLGKAFVAPLLLSPVVAFVIGAVFCFGVVRMRLAKSPAACLCVETQSLEVQGGAIVARATSLRIDSTEACATDGAVAVATVDASRVAAAAPYAVGGAICFARALNDTPKIAALVLGTQLLGANASITVVAGAMAAGGLLFSRRVAEKMSHGVATVSPAEGLASNTAAAGLVLFASKLGLPVSTTHVTCGALFGAGAANGTADRSNIVSILTAWVSTLPCAAALGAVAYLSLSALRSVLS